MAICWLSLKALGSGMFNIQLSTLIKWKTGQESRSYSKPTSKTTPVFTASGLRAVESAASADCDTASYFKRYIRFNGLPNWIRFLMAIDMSNIRRTFPAVNLQLYELGIWPHELICGRNTRSQLNFGIPQFILTMISWWSHSAFCCGGLLNLNTIPEHWDRSEIPYSLAF